MFAWPGIPSSRAPEHELADFAELLCWRDGNISITALIQSLGRADENDYASTGVPEEDEAPKDIEAAFLEIERRIEACNAGYPFDLSQSGRSLHSIQNSGSSQPMIYKYLLLATRLNMSKNRTHAGIDGALLFEEVSSEAARSYLGPSSESMIFGTAAEATNFEGKVNDLCQRIGEGDGYKNRPDSQGHQRDGKLDVVLWKHFADRMPGKFVAFGQCKTGTSYLDTLTQLQPESFCRKWMQSFPIPIPTRMFFVAEALPRGGWYNIASDAGLLFDRCRIAEFSQIVNQELLDKVEAWTAAAAKATDLLT